MKKERVFIFFAAIAVLIVIMQAGRPHFFPKRSSISLNSGNSIDHVETDKGTVVISRRKLVFATPEGELIRIRNASDDGTDSEPRILDTDGETVYAVVLDVFPDIDYKSAEKIVRYNFEGKRLGEIYCEEYNREDRGNINSIKDISTDGDKVYLTCIEKGIVSLLRVSASLDENQVPETLVTFTPPEHIRSADYIADEDVLELYNVYNETYRYDIQSGTLSFHPEISGKKPEARKADLRLSVSRRQEIIDILYYASLVVLLGAAVLFIVHLGRSGLLMSYRIFLVFGLIFIYATGFYTEKEVGDYEDNFREIVEYTSNSMTVGVDFFLKDFLENNTYSGPEDLKNEEVRTLIDRVSYYVDDVCSAVGSNISMYAQVYLLGADGKAFLISDSFDEFTVGTEYGDVTGIALPPGGYDRPEFYQTVKAEEADGVYLSSRNKLLDADGKLIGFLELGSEYGKLRSRLVRRTIENALEMLAFVFFLYILFDVIHKYRDEIHKFRILRKTDPFEARISLSNTYDFIVSFLVYIDTLIMVKAVAEMAGTGVMDIAIAFAIPLTAYRIGSSLGSAITSIVIGAFGEKKMGIISSVITVLTFIGMAFSVSMKNVYVFAALKFVEGIFLESILFSIAEGIPYEIEEENSRNKKILESQSASSAASMIALMTAGIISEYLSYTALYAFCGIMTAVLIPMSVWILNNDDGEDEGINTLKVWRFFFRPRTFSYIIMVILMVSMMYGYTDYIFPLIAENSGMSGIMLSSIGVLVGSMEYFGEGILGLFKGQTPIRSVVTAFTVCGAGLFLVLLRPTVIIAIITLVITCVFMRVIENYKIICMIDINDSDDIDNKDIQENYYTLEDTFKILHGPVLGALASVSAGLASAFLGLLSIVLPRSYYLLRKFIFGSRPPRRDGASR